MNRNLTINAAIDSGFFVTGPKPPKESRSSGHLGSPGLLVVYGDPPILFAGTLDECLAYMKTDLEKAA